MDAAEVPVEVPVTRPSGLGAGRLRTILVLAAAVVLVVAAVWFVNPPGGDANVRPGDSPVGDPPRVGAAPPDFSGTAIDGTAVSMAALAGQPTWLTFGASWCPDCRAEANDLQAAYAKYRPQGLAVLGVFIDEPETAVVDYAQRVGFTFPLAGGSRRQDRRPLPDLRHPDPLLHRARRDDPATCGSAG